jgi:CHAD domain-containing protein
MPSRAADLPSAEPWCDLSRAVDVRRLLVQAEIGVRSQTISVLNTDAKTTARLHLERFSAVDPQGHRHLVRTATVSGLRGYERAAARLRAGLEAAGLPADGQPVLPAVLSVLGLPAPGPAPGPGVGLDRLMPASGALALVLGRLREHVISNQHGVLERLDIEFLHEFRVAIRRSRSMVKLASSSLDPARREHFAGELAWLGTVTSPVRDLDVHVEELGYDPQDNLDPLRVLLAARRDEAQPVLAAALRSRRYESLLAEWGRMADPATQGGTAYDVAVDAGRPIGEVADGYIWRAFRRVVRHGRSITADSPPGLLHDLRKRAKELRYLLECFQTLYPEEELRTVVRELKLLQDNLGEYQDCQVQADALRELADEIMATRSAPAATLMAMGRLAEDQRRRERASREEFSARFERFASSENRKRFKLLVSATSLAGLPPRTGSS